MEKQPVIISERKRPFWRLILASICFTVAFTYILDFILLVFFDLSFLNHSTPQLILPLYLIGFGVSLSIHQRIYIDIEHSKFRTTKEIGPLKIGRWITIKNYEYVSLFTEKLRDGSTTFSVNLWYDNNCHFTLYSEPYFESALEIAYHLSEELNIDLLDATIAHDFKWIDKEALKAQETTP